MTKPPPFPWASVMQFAFGQLRLSPEAFWSMTMREMNSAMRQHFGDGASVISRQELQQLIEQHPDQVPQL